ncbi:hypothetical protein [Segetibacter aerophilus]|uniref:hypothetical protein n=1 Tax=Segetibacter aerophilus TaxID=670293 RepID=UPI0011BECF9B|nr:hypothetical protein [Segetibacter aerophilus]
MKKLLYSIFFVLILATTSCQFINSSAKVLVKCCRSLLIANRDKTDDRKDKDLEYLNTASLRPVNSWDGKMMIW